MNSKGPTALQGLSKGNILIVDDCPANLRLLSRMLTERGYKVRAAPSGARALDAARSTPPDLILLDVMMPEMDGYEVCERLKADVQTHDIPIIFISALDRTEDKVKAFIAGGVDYITKPFQVEEVAARVETHLALRVLQKNLQDKNTQLQQEITERVRAESQRDATLETLERRHRELTTLYEAATAISSDLSLDVVLQTVAEQMMQALDLSGCALSLWNRERDLVETWVDCNTAVPETTDPIGTTYALADYPATRCVLETGRPIVIRHDDPQADAAELALMKEQKTLTLLMLPLVARDQVMGLVELIDNLQARDFTPEQTRLAQSLAAQAAIAIENARLYEAARRELTERVLAEKALRGRTAELEARNAELDAFAHTVAHDLKSPLGPIVGYAQVLEDHYARLPEEEMRDYLRLISESGAKMGSIIDELLLLSSVRELKEVKTEALDMAQLVAEAQKRLAHLIEEHQAEIVLLPAEDWPVVQGYGPWVEEVWVNYLSNAIKYGGRPPRIECGAGPPPSSPSLGGIEGGLVCFWVRDGGSGLTPEEQERLFTPFERLHQMRVKGHGLGLSIVKRIVEKLGGQVGVESQAGQGSTFFFTLPRA
ncbi:MAG: response regulator [Anaerolineae bacterium]|jgi:signal transduction histidine kinase/DNA-binding response OmpR family regulator